MKYIFTYGNFAQVFYLSQPDYGRNSSGLVTTIDLLGSWFSKTSKGCVNGFQRIPAPSSVHVEDERCFLGSYKSRLTVTAQVHVERLFLCKILASPNRSSCKTGRVLGRQGKFCGNVKPTAVWVVGSITLAVRRRKR